MWELCHYKAARITNRSGIRDLLSQSYMVTGAICRSGVQDTQMVWSWPNATILAVLPVPTTAVKGLNPMKVANYPKSA